MKNAPEVFEMRSGTLSFAVRRIQVDRGLGLRPAPCSLLAGVDPKPSRLGAPSAWIEHRHGRVIGEQVIRSKQVSCKAFVQRLEPPAGAADPSGERRTRKIDPMAGEDLRLPVERRVIAIFADQHLGKQRRRRQAAGDRPLCSRRLRHRLAGPAGVFGTGGADYAKLSRNPIQHLAHALADDMQRAAAAAADRALNVEADLFARQMIGQRLATRGPFGLLLLAMRTLLFFAGKIAVDLFERERQLVGIKALGTTAKLRPLQLFDNRLQALDLAVAVLDGGSHIANEMLQKSRFGRQIVEIEPHVRIYPIRVIRRSDFIRFYAGFCSFLARQSRLPYAFRRSPVDAFNQHGELRWRERHRAAGIAHPRPDETTLIEPLVTREQKQTIPSLQRSLSV